MQAGAIRHRECFAVRYGLRLVFYTEGSLDSIKNFAIIPCALILKRIYYAETSQMCLRPQPAQGERPFDKWFKVVSLPNHLFEGLPGMAEQLVLPLVESVTILDEQ